ncbi:tetratricopeptide repeat protein [Streptomyces sp. NPDC057403]|uniref:tetratricopeptide repeat protein n=1 Tax=Streptomyces sp. NPDC057403 TaxID=3346119 RepID=UPI0036B2D369
MSRPSGDTQREQQGTAPSALAAAPIDVHIPADPTGAAATIGGVPLSVADGEDVQQAVLGHLRRIALATGHPARATIHDERLGFVVPLQVAPDGSSHLTGSPTPAPRRATPAPAPASASRPATPAPRPTSSAPDAPAVQPATPAPAASAGQPATPAPAASVASAGHPPTSAPAAPAASAGRPTSTPDPTPVPPTQAPRGGQDGPAGPLRQQAEPARENVPTFSLRAVSAPQPLGRHAPAFPARAAAESAAGSAPTFAIRAVPERAPGTVAPPTGVFGPPPLMDAVPPRPAPGADTVTWPSPADADAPEDTTPGSTTPPVADAAGTSRSSGTPLLPRLDPEPAPKSAPTPARGFDAVAEAVLGDEPPTAPGFLLEPMAQVNDAVRSGRIAEADQLATRVVGEASAVLGLEHPEVLKLRELAAYIAYLAGEPVRAHRLSIDLARLHRRLGNAEGAYGNIQSAASAWRAVRDPEQGLALGRDLIGLWSELVAEGGPAAEETERLDSARTRMGRLAERARNSAR